MGNEHVYQAIQRYGKASELRIEGYGFGGGSCYFNVKNFWLEAE